MNTAFLSPRVGAVAGLAGASGLLAIGIAANLIYKQPGSGVVTLDEIWAADGRFSMLLSLGLIVTGLLLLVFGMGLYKALERSTLSSVGTGAYSLSGLALMGLGVIDISGTLLLSSLSTAFFVLAGIGLLLLIVPLQRSALFQRSGAVAAGLAVVLPMIIWPLAGIALMETLMFLAIIAWSLFASIRMMVIYPPVSHIFPRYR